MKRNKTGSALLCVLLVLSIIVPYLFTLVRASSFAVDNALCVRTYVQQKYLTEALLNYGVSVCCYNFDELKEDLSDNNLVIFELHSWAPIIDKEEVGYKGKIEFTPAGKDLHVQATLQDKNTTCAHQMACDVIKNGEHESYTIQNWQHINKKK
ncbi:hypothetical protein HRU45_01690 [Candidatus Dependentiae bacterium]|nr:hypothetical protein [Candidatus Dependentiae bacterium]